MQIVVRLHTLQFTWLSHPPGPADLG
jgi:hypothetical protein